MTAHDPDVALAVSLTVALIGKTADTPRPEVVRNMLNEMYAAVQAVGVIDIEKPSGGRALTEAEIKATITEDGQHLVSLEDGKKYKSLKRHLSLAGLTPDQYRAKWGLPAAYPMVSVAYSIRRRDLALAAGLGRGKKK